MRRNYHDIPAVLRELLSLDFVRVWVYGFKTSLNIRLTTTALIATVLAFAVYFIPRAFGIHDSEVAKDLIRWIYWVDLAVMITMTVQWLLKKKDD